MTKTRLTLEDVEQIKQSKGKLPASEVQRKYSIGWERLQKLWKDTPAPITLAGPTTKQDLAQQEELQREIERVTAQVPAQREIVVEDFFARLGQLEAKLGIQTTQMERQTTQMERQTELMQNILDSLDAVSDIESDTQSILEQENRESHTLQDIGRSIQEYMEFTKTLVYSAVIGFAAWQLLCKTWKHVDKGTSPVSVPTTAVPAAPTTPAPAAPAPTRLSWVKKPKTPDPFVMQ